MHRLMIDMTDGQEGEIERESRVELNAPEMERMDRQSRSARVQRPRGWLVCHSNQVKWSRTKYILVREEKR